MLKVIPPVTDRNAAFNEYVNGTCVVDYLPILNNLEITYAVKYCIDTNNIGYLNSFVY
jgi:hypothetical protein